MKEGKYMNLFQTQTTTSKLEELRQQSALHNSLQTYRKQHLNKLYGAFKTLLEELKTLAIGNLETAQKVQA